MRRANLLAGALLAALGVLAVVEATRLRDDWQGARLMPAVVGIELLALGAAHLVRSAPRGTRTSPTSRRSGSSSMATSVAITMSAGSLRARLAARGQQVAVPRDADRTIRRSSGPPRRPGKCFSASPTAETIRYDATVPVWERFPKAPITEAILDIQVRFSSPVEMAHMEAFHDLIRASYPVKQGHTKWQGEIQLNEGSVAQAVRQQARGFLFRSADERRVVQARQDGFTFNWLKKYESWETLRNEARRQWEIYRDTFRPEAVMRLGLRYVNRIEIPLPFTDFREYVKTTPEVAAGVPQGLSALFMRLEIPDEARGLMGIITETFQVPVDDGKRLPFIFDIDVVRQATFEPNSPAIWEMFEKMREYKNEIFFYSMTERAFEMFR